MTNDQLNEIWRQNTAGEPLTDGVKAHTDKDENQTISTANQSWRRKKEADSWHEVPPLTGNLDPEKTQR